VSSDEVSGRPLQVVRFERRVEAAAFVAALSRVLDSPRGEPGETAEVWAAPEDAGDAVALYLNPPALAAAVQAFPPVPASPLDTNQGPPRAAVRVLGGRHVHAMGLEEAARRLQERT
jgi:hypothetical protein